VTKRIARKIERLVRHHLSIDHLLFPYVNSRAAACASISEGR
jgi:hypothetical protein